MVKNDHGGTAHDGDDDVGSEWRQVAQRQYDPASDHELATTIITAIAEAKGLSPSEVTAPPLYEVVDTAALEATFFGPDVAGNSRQGSGTVEFEYLEYLVVVASDGWVRVYEPAIADGGGRSDG